jgi:hypothetical protein
MASAAAKAPNRCWCVTCPYPRRNSHMSLDCTLEVDVRKRRRIRLSTRAQGPASPKSLAKAPASSLARSPAPSPTGRVAAGRRVSVTPPVKITGEVNFPLACTNRTERASSLFTGCKAPLPVGTAGRYYAREKKTRRADFSIRYRVQGSALPRKGETRAGFHELRAARFSAPRCSRLASSPLADALLRALDQVSARARTILVVVAGRRIAEGVWQWKRR